MAQTAIRVRFARAQEPPPALTPARRGWLDTARLAAGFGSVGAALLASVLLEPRVPHDAHARLTAGLIALGILVFGALMVWWGRDLARAWLGFGARLGFGPATRRALHDLGTDRPPLVGQAGEHSARIRLVTSGARRARRALQAELELVGVDPSWWLRYDGRALAACDERLARRLEPWLANLAELRLQEGRLVARAPFAGPSDAVARLLLADAARIADELQKPL